MEIYDLPDQEFKITVLKRLSESYIKTLTDNSTKSEKQYMNKMRCLTKR